MNDPNVIGDLSVKYSKNTGIKALLKLVPGWSAADTLLQKRADEIKSDRLKVFFEELALGNYELTEELIQSDSFLHAYFCTLRATMSCRQHEKIENFAKLLSSTLNPALGVTEDEHEELLALLEEITIREFAILRDLRNLELANTRQEKENELQNAWKYWLTFKSGVLEKYGVPEESFNAYMVRLERTGLYMRITGTFLNYNGDIGCTTPLLARVIALITDKS